MKERKNSLNYLNMRLYNIISEIKLETFQQVCRRALIILYLFFKILTLSSTRSKDEDYYNLPMLKDCNNFFSWL